MGKGPGKSSSEQNHYLGQARSGPGPAKCASAEILVLDPQRTQWITGSAFRIPLQPDWRSRQTKQRPFLTGQSWRALKSGYTARSPEQGFRRCFADGVNQFLISSARRLWSYWRHQVILFTIKFLMEVYFLGYIVSVFKTLLVFPDNNINNILII